jgi:ADP-ribose pyrophosphatase
VSYITFKANRKSKNDMAKVQAWKELRRKLIFKKYGRGIEEVIYEMPDGSQADFYIKSETESVAVLALTEAGEVLLARQYRPGPNKIIDELPGGGVDAGETALKAAQRELVEETGYTGELAYVGKYFDDAYSNLQRHCVVATQCKKVGEPLETPTEQIEVIRVTLDDLKKRLRQGMFTDIAAGYMGLEYLGLL